MCCCRRSTECSALAISGSFSLFFRSSRLQLSFLLMIILSGLRRVKDAVAYLKKLVPSQHPFALHALGDIQAYLIYVHEVEIVDAVAARTRIGIAAAVLRHRRHALIDNNLFVRCHTPVTVICGRISYSMAKRIPANQKPPPAIVVKRRHGFLQQQEDRYSCS